MIKNPCFDVKTKTDCPKRCPGCSASCPEWDEYTKKRDSIYNTRLEDRKLREAMRDVGKKHVKMVHEIQYRHNKRKF